MDFHNFHKEGGLLIEAADDRSSVQETLRFATLPQSVSSSNRCPFDALWLTKEEGSFRVSRAAQK
jgi:hypothetical protein